MHNYGLTFLALTCAYLHQPQKEFGLLIHFMCQNALTIGYNLQNIIETLRSQTSQTKVSEITLEVNPSKDLCLSRLDEFVDAGVNRFSLGVQVKIDK